MPANALMLNAMMIPKTQSAIIANEAGMLEVSHDVPLPEIEPDMVLVKTVAVAINPVDVKLTGPMAHPGAIAGSDLSGIIVALGSNVSNHRFSVGDRVSTVVPTMNSLLPRVGAWAQYVVAWADFLLKVPKNLSLESASTLGVGLSAVGYALFRSLEIPGHPDKPAENPEFVLVYGGSTATGTLAIQVIRKSGLIPITTCSRKNFTFVERYGAEKAFDYHEPNAAEEIKAYTKNALWYALDCFCEGSSMKFCYAAIGRAGGRYTTLEPYPDHLATRRTVRADWLLGPALLGQDVGWKDPYYIKGDPELRAFGRQWFNCAQRMLDKGELKTHPCRVGTEIGLSGILKGTEVLRKKELSAEKLVYRICEA